MPKAGGGGCGASPGICGGGRCVRRLDKCDMECHATDDVMLTSLFTTGYAQAQCRECAQDGWCTKE